MSVSVAPSIGDVLGASGEPPVIVHKGQPWKLGYPTDAAKDRLEKLIVAAAWENVKAAELGIPEVDASARESFHKAVRNREYRTGGTMWAEAFSRTDGQVLFYLSLLQEHHPEATAKDVIAIMAECPDEFMTAMLLVTPRFFYIAAEAQGLPPAQRDKFAREQTAKFKEAVSQALSNLQPRTTPSS